MHKLHLTIASAGMALIFALGTAVAAEDQSSSPVTEAKQTLKEGGRTIGHATRDATRAIGHGTRDAAKAIGHASKDAATGVAKAASNSWNKLTGRHPEAPARDE